jgi:hypothetical protein
VFTRAPHWSYPEILEINSRIKYYEIKQLQHLGRMSRTYFLNYAQTKNPEAEETNKDAHIKGGENSIEFNCYNLKS